MGFRKMKNKIPGAVRYQWGPSSNLETSFILIMPHISSSPPEETKDWINPSANDTLGKFGGGNTAQ